MNLLEDLPYDLLYVCLRKLYESDWLSIKLINKIFYNKLLTYNLRFYHNQIKQSPWNSCLFIKNMKEKITVIIEPHESKIYFIDYEYSFALGLNKLINRPIGSQDIRQHFNFKYIFANLNYTNLINGVKKYIIGPFDDEYGSFYFKTK